MKGHLVAGCCCLVLIITKDQIHFSGVHFNNLLRLEEHSPAFTSEDFVLCTCLSGSRDKVLKLSK